jgi:hypothetical protein
VNGLKVPKELRNPRFNTKTNLPFELENVVRQLAGGLGKKVAGPDIKGTFQMYGTFGISDKVSGVEPAAWLRAKPHERGLKLKLTPTVWTKEPPGGNWVTVGLEATPKPGEEAVLLAKVLVNGKLEPQCTSFELRRVGSSGGGVDEGSGSRKSKWPNGLQYHSYKVRGAGTNQVNGEYLFNGTSADGWPQYKHVNEWATVLPKHLYALSPLGQQQKRVTLLHHPEIQATETRMIPASWYLSDLGEGGVAGDGGDLDFYRQASTSAYPPTDANSDGSASWSDAEGSGSAWFVDGDGKSPGPLLRLVVPEGGLVKASAVAAQKVDGRTLETSEGKMGVQGEWVGTYTCHGMPTSVKLTTHCLQHRGVLAKPGGVVDEVTCSSLVALFDFSTMKAKAKEQQKQQSSALSDVIKQALLGKKSKTRKKGPGNVTVVRVENYAPLKQAKFPYAIAEFGPSLASLANRTVELVGAKPPSGCELANAKEVVGKVVLVQRGGCMFVEKAKAAQDAGAIAIIITNNQPELMVLSADVSGKIGKTIKIPAMMVTEDGGRQLVAAVGQKKGGEGLVIEVKTEWKEDPAAEKTEGAVVTDPGGVEGVEVVGMHELNLNLDAPESMQQLRQSLTRALASHLGQAGGGDDDAIDAQVVIVQADGEQFNLLGGGLSEEEEEEDEL